MALRPQKILGTTLVGALAVQTVGSIDENHRLPPPRLFVAVFLLWFILGLVAQLGERIGRVAAGFSGLVLLSLTMSKGKVLIETLTGLAATYGNINTTTATTGYPSGAAWGTPGVNYPLDGPLVVAPGVTFPSWANPIPPGE